MGKFKQYLLVIAGFVFLVLGVVGIVIPVLPTTPFFLLASYCFLRSSKRLYDWLIHHRLFGRYIRNYLIYKAVDKRSKIIALIILWAGLFLSMYLVKKWLVVGILLIVGTAVSFHILSLKTLTKEQEAVLEREAEIASKEETNVS